MVEGPSADRVRRRGARDTTSRPMLLAEVYNRVAGIRRILAAVRAVCLTCAVPHFRRRPREGGDPVFQSFSDQFANAAAYWMPAFAGMTASFGVSHCLPQISVRPLHLEHGRGRDLEIIALAAAARDRDRERGLIDAVDD